MEDMVYNVPLFRLVGDDAIEDGEMEIRESERGKFARGRIVRAYVTETGVRIFVSDAAYAGKTEAELEEVRKNASRVAWGIAYNAELRRLGLA